MNAGDWFLRLLIFGTILALIGAFITMRLEWQWHKLQAEAITFLEPKLQEKPKILEGEMLRPKGTKTSELIEIEESKILMKKPQD
ncbi:MAG: hypothetical protein LLF94_12450 [Chlamydiales bacterium]|nr:hypothetical protein [Chlamydiales bacterium]